MKIPLLWLSDYVELSLSPDEMAHRLSMAGAEVETVEGGADWDGVSVGLVTAVEPHPNADRLRLATVDVGEGEPQTVVCGAPNVAVGQKIAFAREGARLIDPRSGERKKLRRSKIRGVVSAGMVCSERELGLSDEHTGILVLEPDVPLGVPLEQALARAVLARTVLEISATPNRPDHLSVLGIAREVAALTGQTVQEPDRSFAGDGPPVEERTSVVIEDPDLCARYIATVITGVKVGPSPSWMQEALLSAGQRPINNVVDVTNYVMLELGQPLHAFDFERLRGGRIVVRRARAGERLRLIDGSEQALAPDSLVIADAEEAVAVAGVMGGAGSEVSEATTTILLEVASFDSASIRRTAAALKQRTEASTRFEKGLNPELAAVASERAMRLLLETAGGRADAGRVDSYPGEQPAATVRLARRRVEQVLGLDVPAERVRSILAALGFDVRASGADGFEVVAPYWRTDIHIADDLVEEVARILGYDALPSAPLRGSIPDPDPQPLLETRESARDALKGAGLIEVINYVTTSEAIIARVQPPESITQAPPLRLFNPLNMERDQLRTTLRPGLLESYAAAVRRRRDAGGGALGLFEVGKVFWSRADDLPDERWLVAALCGGAVAPFLLEGGSGEGGRGVDFFDAKAVAEAVASSLGVAFRYEAPAAGEGDPALEAGESARIGVGGPSGGKMVGVLGRVQAAVRERFDIEDEVYLLELDVSALAALPRASINVGRVSRFPAVSEDLAVVVEASTPAGAVEAVLLRQELVERAELFDVYVGPQIPSGKRSLAYALTYRAPDRTLTDAEVAAVRASMVGELGRELGGVVREG